jgi:hypothetical protein
MGGLTGLDRVADPASGAGACATAAATTAYAAALLEKTTGDSLAVALRERAIHLGGDSEAAFLSARAELARAGEGGRDEPIADALDVATATPLAVASTAADIAQLAHESVDHVDPMLRAELVAAAVLCDAVCTVCAHLVEINLVNAGLAAVQDEARAYAAQTAAHRAALITGP